MKFVAGRTIEKIPIIDAIFNVAIVLEDLRKQLAQEFVIWCLLEAELADIVEVDRELLCTMSLVHLEVQGGEKQKNPCLGSPHTTP